MTFKKIATALFYLSPVGLLLIFPFVETFGLVTTLDDKLRLVAVDNMRQILMAQEWATLMAEHYLQVLALVLAVLCSLRAGTGGLAVRLLALLSGLLMILLTYRLIPFVNPTMLTIFPVLLTAFMALGLLAASGGSGDEQEVGFKKIRNLNWLLAGLNAGLWAAPAIIFRPSDSGGLLNTGLSDLLILLLVFTLTSLALAQAGRRVKILSRLCLLTSVLMILTGLWVVGQYLWGRPLNYYGLMNAMARILYVAFMACLWLALIVSVVRLALGLKKGPVQAPGAAMRPAVNLAGAGLGAGLLLAALLVGGVYGPWHNQPPPAVKPLPSGFEFGQPYYLGSVSARLPQGASVSGRSPRLTIDDGYDYPLELTEIAFSSPEKMESEYEEALSGYGHRGFTVDEQADLSGFEAYAPALYFNYSVEIDSKQGRIRLRQLCLKLRFDQGYILIKTSWPKVNRKTAADLEAEQTAVFLARAGDLLRAYRWLGSNQAPEGQTYSTGLGRIDLAKIQAGQLSGHVDFNYFDQGANDKNMYIFTVRLNPKNYVTDYPDKISPVVLLAGKLAPYLSLDLMENDSLGKSAYHFLTRDVSGRAGRDIWSLYLFRYEPCMSGANFEWISESSGQNRSGAANQINLKLMASNGRGNKADQDLWLSVWQGFLDQVEIDAP